MLRAQALAAALLSLLAGCSLDVRQCQLDSECGAGKSCDRSSLGGYGICRSACGDAACTASQTCVNSQCVARPPSIGAGTVTANSTANGWYPLDPSGAAKISVSVAIADYGSGIASVSLAAGGVSVPGSFDSASGGYRFLVPTTAQTPLRETALPFVITAADGAGNVATGAPSNNPLLPIDNLGPAISGISIAGYDALVGSVPYFRQLDGSGGDTLGPIDVQATIADNGSGVDPASLKLVLQSSPATRVDTPGTAARTPGTNSWHFKVPRVGQVAKGGQGRIAFRVVATDLLGNLQQADGAALAGGGSAQSAGVLGIDGQPPLLTFDLAAPGEYPAVGSKCDQSGGGLTCGHDGNRFWRIGDDGSTLFYTADDQSSSGGSGINVAAGSATCAITGQTGCVAAFSPDRVRFEFAINPSQATFASDSNGEGTASVTVTAKDVVGNQASLTRPVNITRLRWVRALPASLGSVKGAPVLAPISGNRYLLVGGTGTSAADTIAQINESGGLVKTAGNGVVGPVLDNMAFSPVTNLLYVVQEGAQKMFAFAVSAAGLSVGYTCDLGGGAKINGAPAIILDRSLERVLVTDSISHSLIALTGVVNGVCESPLLWPKQTIGVGSVASPSTDGANVYVSYQTNGIAKVPFSGGAFQTAVLLNPVPTGQVGPVSLVQSRLYVGFNQTRTYRAYGTDLAPATLWPATAGAMSDAILAPPVVNNGLVIGAADINDGFLRVFLASDGSIAFFYNPTAPANYALSAVAISSTVPPVYYFSDGSGELDAVLQDATSGVTTPKSWASSFKGKTVFGATDLSFTNYGTEPVIGPDGTLYFVANNATNTNANVYAIMTDTGPGVAPGPTNWPRVGFDNCNSNNSSLTNCQ